jgi:hypothetical protein
MRPHSDSCEFASGAVLWLSRLPSVTVSRRRACQRGQSEGRSRRGIKMDGFDEEEETIQRSIANSF